MTRMGYCGPRSLRLNWSRTPGNRGDANAVKAALKSPTTRDARSRTRAAPRRARGRGWASRQGQPHRGRRGPLRPDQGPSRASRARGQGGHGRPLIYGAAATLSHGPEPRATLGFRAHEPLGLSANRKIAPGAAMNPSPEPLATLGSRVNSASGSWSGRPDLNRRPQRPERCALNQLRYSPTHTLL